MKPININIVLSILIILAGIGGLKELNACTAIYVKKKNSVLVGNNEDGSNPESRIWIEPGGSGQYGRVYFGFSDLNPQGGINEKGLWLDAFGLAYENPSKIKGEVYPGDLQDKILAECATIEYVVKVLKKYNRSQMNRYQWMIGDKNGHSAIIEDDTIIYPSENFQIITNFRQSQFPGGNGYDCLRYRTVEKMMRAGANNSVEDIRKILSATHSEGEDVTSYSYIADLTKGIIYLYNFHNYEDAVILNVADEIKKGKNMYILSELFPVTVAAEFYNYRIKNELSQKIELKRYKNFDNSRLPDFCGVFKITSPLEMAGQTLTLTNGKEFINLQLNNGGPYKLVPLDANSFFMMSYGGIDFTCRFEKNDNQTTRLFLGNAGFLVEAYRIQ